MDITRIGLLGGSGFVGRHLVHAWSAQGIACRVLTRHAHRHQGLLTTPDLELRQVDVFDPAALTEALRGCQAAVNLVGILNPGRGASFHQVHVALVETLVDSAVAAGVSRLLHMSALGADAEAGSSAYLRSKGAGERQAHEQGAAAGLAVTAFRPSVIFGPDDSFTNRFAALLRLPGPFPLACPDARFAPVYVGDVAKAFARALQEPATTGHSYDLCGPEEWTLEQLVHYLANLLQRRKLILRLPDWASRLQANLLQFAPGKPFTPDNYLSLQTPSVCASNRLPELGVTPTMMDAVVPGYVGRRLVRGQRGPA